MPSRSGADGALTVKDSYDAGYIGQKFPFNQLETPNHINPTNDTSFQGFLCGTWPLYKANNRLLLYPWNCLMHELTKGYDSRLKLDSALDIVKLIQNKMMGSPSFVS